MSQVYDYQNGQSILTGQKASQTLSVKVRNISDGTAIGKLIEAATKISGISISGVYFDLADRSAGNKQARKAAFDSAKRKADEYARLNGLKTRGVIRIEALGSGNIYPYYTSADAFVGDFKTLIPVRDTTISESVTVWFAFTA